MMEIPQKNVTSQNYNILMQQLFSFLSLAPENKWNIMVNINQCVWNFNLIAMEAIRLKKKSYEITEF